MKALIFTLLFLILKENPCTAQCFTKLSLNLEKKCVVKKKKNKFKGLTFYDIRKMIYENNKLSFINCSSDTLFILERYDIQDGSYKGRIWNTHSFVQYEYDKPDGLVYTNKKIFRKYAIELVGQWDTSTIEKQEQNYADIYPVRYVYAARLIIGEVNQIDCFKFRDFKNPEKD